MNSTFSSLRDVESDDEDDNKVTVQLQRLRSDTSGPTLNDFTDNDVGKEPTERQLVPLMPVGRFAYLKAASKEIFFGTRMNILMVFGPIAIVSSWFQVSEGLILVCALLALCPFAERISFVTEDLAKYTNDTVGGLLNATFGNITEVIVCIFALRAGLIRVVQVSMLGSVLSNLLLVLGCAFLVGGIKYSEQKFNATAAITNSGMLLLSLCALSLPTVLSSTHTGADGLEPLVNRTAQAGPERGKAPLGLSRFISFLMLLMYCAYIFFQMVTHKSLFEGQEDDDDDGDDEPILGFFGGIGWLGVLTLIISVLSDFTVYDAIDGAANDLNLPYLFIGTILIPIVGNAAEHAAAVIFAHKNKMEIAMGIAVGSAVQISLFVIPLCVIIGWGIDVPMDLDFHPFETVSVLLTTITVALMIQDGKSTWLKGVLLIAMYIVIAASFWSHSDPRTELERGGGG